jgi:hypothetical protein
MIRYSSPDIVLPKAVKGNAKKKTVNSQIADAKSSEDEVIRQPRRRLGFEEQEQLNCKLPLLTNP